MVGDTVRAVAREALLECEYPFILKQILASFLDSSILLFDPRDSRIVFFLVTYAGISHISCLS
jgi:hypothetical protein